jgi:hypothetical protein
MNLEQFKRAWGLHNEFAARVFMAMAEAHPKLEVSVTESVYSLCYTIRLAWGPDEVEREVGLLPSLSQEEITKLVEEMFSRLLEKKRGRRPALVRIMNDDLWPQ